jgi:thioredoxin reductase (NADPH)
MVIETQSAQSQTTSEDSKVWDVIIIGGGPAGLSAALYAARAMRTTLVLEREMPGGQIATTSEVEDYPGVLMTTGPELSMQLMEHAQHFGAQVEIGEHVTQVKLDGQVKKVRTESGRVFHGRSVILATGAEPRTLGVPGEDKLRGRGVSYCAVCDGPFFRNRPVAVVGGGDAAFDEALYLTKYASRVYLIHRRDEFRAQKVLVDRARENERIEFILDTVVDTINGDSAVETATIRNLKTGETRDLELGGLFVYIGNIPSTNLLERYVEIDDTGYIEVDATMATGCPGVYVAGDVRKSPLKQIVTAGSDGSIAALSADKYLDYLAEALSPEEAEKLAEAPENWEDSY